MKTITLWQPWAQWVAERFKTIETRTHDRFRNLAGQRIAIHAAQKFEVFPSAWKEYWSVNGKFSGETWNRAKKNRGVILCTVLVERVGWLDGSHSAAAMIDCENVKRFGLFLTDVKILENPIPWKGQQGIFSVDL